jgi:hypothetical protein
VITVTESVKSTRATVTLGALTVDGFMRPDGAYRMSQTQAAECVNLTERNAREFLQSKALKSLLGEAYMPAISDIEPYIDQLRGGSVCHGIRSEKSVGLPGKLVRTTRIKSLVSV